jgi:hypothetical protein
MSCTFFRYLVDCSGDAFLEKVIPNGCFAYDSFPLKPSQTIGIFVTNNGNF